MINSSGIILSPKIVPEPKSSRMVATITTAKVYPMALPSPSTIEAKTPFFEAKDSALARIIQLTTISGIKSPKKNISLINKLPLAFG